MYRIALVVDEVFGSKLLELAQAMYVWLIESAENCRWAELTWQRSPTGGDPLARGVTTFRRQDGEDLDALIIRLLDMIDEHHGEFAHDPEWSEIDVVGAIPSSAVVEAAAAYGVDRCETVPGGFRLHRPGSNSPPDTSSSG